MLRSTPVPIRDTDELREVCSGMWGGKEAFIEGCSSNPPTIPILDCSYHRVVTFDPTSNGQVALVIYEWNDVPCLGVTTPDNSVGGVYRPVRL